MSDDLWMHVRRVPRISDAKIAEMRHIEPVLYDPDTNRYRKIDGVSRMDPRYTSFLWDAKPAGEPFRVDRMQTAHVITQHKSDVFFKPSLAEVYAWIRFYLSDRWSDVKFFCINTQERIHGGTDVVCQCLLIGGDPIYSKDVVQ